MTYTYTTRTGKRVSIGRAPKGGLVYNDRYYRGGQFCPMAAMSKVLLAKTTATGKAVEIRQEGGAEVAYVDGVRLGEGWSQPVPAHQQAGNLKGVSHVFAVKGKANIALTADEFRALADARLTDEDKAEFERGVAWIAEHDRIANDGLRRAF